MYYIIDNASLIGKYWSVDYSYDELKDTLSNHNIILKDKTYGLTCYHCDLTDEELLIVKLLFPKLKIYT